ncbi:bifunctional diaminohydroxyphosphoribosylaminopyrimidine deaminase/5-amino-6-(5-phosphoribosylamino)uracil reductase RibD [Anoxynatronum buryatiense]|uniref:Riboflavin biosynthesis protein RibD n=1 Tax=Anoxynatronum buryatiense TaxID=489973 RepID=A0AA46AI74_9CLOT|nr:bifunctional diaminohydroxyphosphoribosylaminopyrimidine deaminase/5-amino-6-(5-phosphoribosylamino)uracil reductase RibD [Anoxynatronum buryatiense]SMP45782.1 diaminohydroxyphosphoribosylaminopyrimidine deaminase [Anoxynatronum buryatiense]
MHGEHEVWMKRALELAEEGWGTTSPNPLVGAVLVKNGKLIGQGRHLRAGGPHAEVEALQQAGVAASGADLYVTLEPCSHFGKTPPCAEALIRAGIRRAYVAIQDPNPLVAGNGIRMLREAGIEVVEGILEHEARELNDIFIHYITHRTPYVIYKTAMSLDGKTAANTGHSQWVTGEAARRSVHWMRQRVGAIMVGISTVLKDDPQLTVRGLPMPPVHPLRIVADSQGRIPLTCQLVNRVGDAPTMVATTERMDQETEIKLRKKGVQVLRTHSVHGQVNLKELLEELGKRNIDSLLLEGGSTLAAAALEQQLVNKIMFYLAPKLIGGSLAPGVLAGKGIDWMDDCTWVDDMKAHPIGEDILITGTIRKR